MDMRLEHLDKCVEKIYLKVEIDYNTVIVVDFNNLLSTNSQTNKTKQKIHQTSYFRLNGPNIHQAFNSKPAKYPFFSNTHRTFYRLAYQGYQTSCSKFTML
jgi:hypothetical protein